MRPCDPYSSKMCVDCKAEYATLYAAGKIEQPFPPRCRGDVRLLEGNVKYAETPAEKAKAVLANPAYWAAYELNTKPRWYQEEMMCCTARMKTKRAGRRIGKTWGLVMGAMHRMATIPNWHVIIVTPYQNQVDLIYQIYDQLASESRSLKDREKRRVRSPQMVELDNGSSMKGFPAGVKSGAKSDKVRGQDADEIILDEVDYIPECDIDAIVAILASNKKTRILVSSTPTGRKTKYYGFCTYKDQMWKEFHYTSMVSPEWTEETEAILRGMYSQSAWEHEILAEFGDFEEGVYPTAKLGESLHNYEYSECKYDPACNYAIGIDWNEHPIGIHMVVVEYDSRTGVFRTVDKRISNDKEFTQHSGIEDIIGLYKRWQLPGWIWADAGAGGMQIESLKRYAKAYPALKLRKKIRGIHMASNEIIKDPITKQDVKKQVKALMVDLTVRRVEMMRCAFPRAEDSEGNLVDQMRNYVVERINPSGLPVYSQGNEHTLVAWQCAMYALIMNLTDIKRVNYCNDVIGVAGPLQKAAGEGWNKKGTSAVDIMGSRDIGTSGDALVKTFTPVKRSGHAARAGVPIAVARRAHATRMVNSIKSRTDW